MKALKEIGLKRAIRFVFFGILLSLSNILLFPQLRSFFFRMLGARIGKDTIIHNVKFVNYYKHGFRKLRIGSSCFIGNDCLIDLSDEVTLEDNVTLSDRVVLLTHLNVGYKDHPLQKYFPSLTEPIKIKEGVFVGINSIVLSGVTIGERAFIGACSLANKDIEADVLTAGVPVRMIRKIK